MVAKKGNTIAGKNGSDTSYEAALKRFAREAPRINREHARESVNPAIEKLGVVRDILEKIERDETSDMSTKDYAIAARATLCEAAEELERSLFTLRVIKPTADFGWFVDKWPKEIQNAARTA